MSGFNHPNLPSDTLFTTGTVVVLIACVIVGIVIGTVTADWMPFAVEPVRFGALAGSAVLS